MRNLRPFEIGDGLDLLAVPAAHLRAGVAAEDRVNVVFLVEIVHHLVAAADIATRR